MNMPEECHYKSYNCNVLADFVIINKSKGEITYACAMCVGAAFVKKSDRESTFSIFPAKDYSNPQTREKCPFLCAWHGPCGQPTVDGFWCKEHVDKKCNCGKHATRECSSYGAFGMVCGYFLCDSCKHESHRWKRA